MRILWKTYFLLLSFSLAALTLLTVMVSLREASRTLAHLRVRQKLLATAAATQVEAGYHEQAWPFELLAALSRNEDFACWRIVDGSGQTVLAHAAEWHVGEGKPVDPRAGSSAEPIHVRDRRGNVEAWVIPMRMRTGLTPWTFWLGFHTRAVHATVYGIVQTNALFGLGIALALIPVSLASTRKLLRPLERLTHTARELEHGNLEAAFPAHGNDEIGQLVGAFGAMVEAIRGRDAEIQDRIQAVQQARDELEVRVQQRTAELSKANHELTGEIAVRRQVEEELRESEGRYRRLLESVTDYICSVAVADGRVMSTSHGPGCVPVTGYLPQEYDADPFLWYRMIHEADRQAVKDHSEAVLAGKNVGTLEHRIVHKDGSIRWISNTPVVRKDENGQVVSYDALIADITKRKQAEAEARRSDLIQTALYDLLQLSLEKMPLEELLKGFIDRLIAVPWLPLQPKACVFLIEDDPGVLVMKAQHGLGCDLLDTCRRVPLGRCLCGQAANSRELVFADRVDDRHDNRCPGMAPHGHYCVPVISSNDSVLGVLNLYVAAGHCRQQEEQAFLQAAAKVLGGIIERKQAEERLKKSQELLEQRVIERTAELLEANRRIRQAQADLVQVEKMGMLGQLVAGVAHEINTPTGAIMNVAADAGGHLRELALGAMKVLELPPDIRRWLADTIPHVLSQQTVVSEIADRDCRREIGRELRQQGIADWQKMAEIMAACGLETSDPLAVRSLADGRVLVFLEHLTALKASSEICHASVKKITRIVKALRYYSRSGEGEMFDINVNESIDNTLVILQNRIKHITKVERHYQDPLPAIRCGPDISQVWTNVLSNACDAIEGAGGREMKPIRIVTLTESTNLIVEIFNEGPPIPPDLILRIFDPFFTTKPIGKGTGLGLSICTGILQKYGGSIAARNEAGGVSFRVSLPLARRNAGDDGRPVPNGTEHAAMSIAPKGADQ